MPVEFDVRVEGLSELERNIQELIDTYGPRNGASTLRLPVRRALQPLLESVRANTPVDTGALQASTALRVGQPSRNAQGPHVNPRTTIVVGQVGWFWKTPSLWRRALAVEFGNSHTPAQPVLIPALREHANQMITTFSSELASNIQRTARRLEARSRAGTLNRR